LGNVWKYLSYIDADQLPITINGKEVRQFYSGRYMYYYLYPIVFVDVEENVLKREMVEEGNSATPPDAPELDCYVFKGWDSMDYKDVTYSRTIYAEYEVAEYCKSSEDESSSSSAKDKSSSSKGKDGIVLVGQVPQFSLAAVGHNIQVSGAPMGSAYAVFDMQGRVLKQGRVESANFGFSMPRAGTYLVRISDQSMVVKLR
jgi:hypothetical protein